MTVLPIGRVVLSQDSRIAQRVEQIGDEVHGDEAAGNEQDDALQGDEVARLVAGEL